MPCMGLPVWIKIKEIMIVVIVLNKHISELR